MGRSLSPVLRQELENLDKDANSRKSAMKALKSYVKDLDSKAIPIFLEHVSETKQTGISSGEHTISLYEVLARVHGPKIVPQIDNIMNTIVKTLSSSAGAFALHQACSKVVPAIARYAIEPTTAEDKKRHIIHSLCKPLSDSLLGSHENLSSGAALCLQALVESDNWRFSSNEMINEVCQRVAGALEKHSQTNSHMALVTALAKHNSLIVEAYARLLVQSGLQILNAGFAEANSQKQLSAIHMVSSLMRCLDPKSLLSELDLVIKEMEKCQSDRMPFVTGAAFEALQIAKKICAGRKNVCSSGDQSPYFAASPESQTVDSFMRNDYFIESAKSTNHGRRVDYDCKNVNRRLWQRSGNGIMDVSLKDGIFSNIAQGNDKTSSECDGLSQNYGDYADDNFSGFLLGNAENGDVRSSTPSPQRLSSHINVDDVKIFTTPRKLIRSLQDLEDSDSTFSKGQDLRFRRTLASLHEQNGPFRDINRVNGGDRFFPQNKLHSRSESVSSTENVSGDKNLISATEVVPVNKARSERVHTRMISARNIIVYVLFAVLSALLLCLLLIGDQDNRDILVPT
ncbi:ARM repeat superfamily protein [Striga hermonthica]|uniref:ARM repeat superfamily protein n=1 Tax=Striga hermonthica TaxID=68872 RepID=A0A9N7NCE9_STRHE|nr:ARM repeat superfamily protein [Striga hermonthica]